jgi:uncharacterized protein (DUF58 family)
MVFFALLFLAVISFLLTRLTARQVQATVRLQTSDPQAGKALDEQYSLKNLNWWPKPLLEVVHGTEPESSPGWIMSLGPLGTSNWAGSKVARSRGIYHFSMLKVVSRDPLGLFSKHTAAGSPQTTLIHPATFELPELQLIAGRAWGRGDLSRQSHLPSPSVGGVCDYVPGDALSRIHWHTTARLNKFMVKELEHEASILGEELWVVLDLWEQVQAGDGAESTVEYGVTIAASVAKKYLNAGWRVGLMAWGDHQWVIEAMARPDQRGRILDTLAVIQPGPEGPVSRAVLAAADYAHQRSGMIVVTPGGQDGIQSVYGSLQSRGIAMTPILLNASSFGDDISSTPSSGVGPSSGLVIHKGDDIARRLTTSHEAFPTSGQRPVAEVHG